MLAVLNTGKPLLEKCPITFEHVLIILTCTDLWYHEEHEEHEGKTIKSQNVYSNWHKYVPHKNIYFSRRAAETQRRTKNKRLKNKDSCFWRKSIKSIFREIFLLLFPAYLSRRYQTESLRLCGRIAFQYRDISCNSVWIIGTLFWQPL